MNSAAGKAIRPSITMNNSVPTRSLQDDKIYVAGHRGLVGSALVRRLEAGGCTNITTRTHAELDLMDQASVRNFFAEERPDAVFLAAAKVGGIHANNIYPAEFVHDNLSIQTHVIHEAWRAGVKRLLFLGSSCIYPRDCPQPMREDTLLTGPLESTNRPYALAKIAGIEMCWSYNRQYGTRFLSVMPTNLYGPGDNFDLQNAHVLPALMRKMHEAKVSGADTVTVWGSGKPYREFLHNDDMADACVYLASAPDAVYSGLISEELCPLINIGWGKDITIADLAALIREVVGFEGELQYDASKPDGAPRKLLDTSRLTALGWQPAITLRQGLEQTYQWFLKHQDAIRG